jgi:hypothetical protein
MNFCEGCHGCTKPCGKEEKAWYYKEEVKMTKYEKLRIVLGVAQLVMAVILAYKFGGV